MLQLLLLYILSAVTRDSVRASVIFEDCGSAYELENVNIRGCSMRLPCFVTVGEDIPVNIDFIARFPSSRLDQDVVININYINLKTSVTPDPCETKDCLMSTDFITSLTSSMSVPRNMALNQRGWLHWRVFNESGRQVLCYRVLVQTQSPLQKILRDQLEDSPGITLIHFSDNSTHKS